MLEIFETKFIEAEPLKKELQNINLNNKLKAKILKGYKKSDFYMKKLEKPKQQPNSDFN